MLQSAGWRCVGAGVGCAAVSGSLEQAAKWPLWFLLKSNWSANRLSQPISDSTFTQHSTLTWQHGLPRGWWEECWAHAKELVKTKKMMMMRREEERVPTSNVSNHSECFRNWWSDLLLWRMFYPWIFHPGFHLALTTHYLLPPKTTSTVMF